MERLPPGKFDFNFRLTIFLYFVVDNIKKGFNSYNKIGFNVVLGNNIKIIIIASKILRIKLKQKRDNI